MLQSDNQDTEKSLDLDTNHLNGNRDFVSSPGYETSSSTAPTSSPDPSEYTYEGAIQDYKTRVSRAGQPNGMGKNGYGSVGQYSKESTPERKLDDYTPRKRSFSAKIEDKLMSIEQRTNEYESATMSDIKKDLPKVNILKRRELFEKDNSVNGNDTNMNNKTVVGRLSSDFSNAKSIKERLSSLEKKDEAGAEATTATTSSMIGGIKDATVKKINRLSGDLTSIKDRLSNLEKSNNNSINEKNNKIDVTLSATLKDRLSSLQSAVKSNNGNQTIIEDEQKSKQLSSAVTASTITTSAVVTKSIVSNAATAYPTIATATAPPAQEDEIKVNENADRSAGLDENENFDTDREDSGIHTTDVSCSVSQSDDQTENNIEELNQIAFNKSDEENYAEEQQHQEQQQQLNQENNNQMVIIPDLIPTIAAAAMLQPSASIEQQQNNGDVQDLLEIDNDIDTAEHDTSVSSSTSSPPTTQMVDGNNVVVNVKQLVDGLTNDGSDNRNNVNNNVEISHSNLTNNNNNTNQNLYENNLINQTESNECAKFEKGMMMDADTFGNVEDELQHYCGNLLLNENGDSNDVIQHRVTNTKNNILNFIKCNLLSETSVVMEDDDERESFSYIGRNGNGTTIDPKMLPHAKSDSTDTTASSNSEINRLLDEELDKLI